MKKEYLIKAPFFPEDFLNSLFFNFSEKEKTCMYDDDFMSFLGRAFPKKINIDSYHIDCCGEFTKQLRLFLKHNYFLDIDFLLDKPIHKKGIKYSTFFVRLIFDPEKLICELKNHKKKFEKFLKDKKYNLLSEYCFQAENWDECLVSDFIEFLFFCRSSNPQKHLIKECFYYIDIEDYQKECAELDFLYSEEKQITIDTLYNEYNFSCWQCKEYLRIMGEKYSNAVFEHLQKVDKIFYDKIKNLYADHVKKQNTTKNMLYC